MIKASRGTEMKYYKAYDERYRQIHEKGLSWASDESTPIVLDFLGKYGIGKRDSILEIGCGEGRDSFAVLDQGYELTATDVSAEAISYCRGKRPDLANSFKVLDCLAGDISERFKAIFSVAVIHMLVIDSDRDAFYSFIRKHLTNDGLGLVCSMGDGVTEFSTDISEAFDLKERLHKEKKVMVAGTSCRKVSSETFAKEIPRNGLVIVEQGLTEALPDFDSLLYAVVRRA